MPYRDELIISTKAGYEMWNGLMETGAAQIPACKPRSEPSTRLGLPYVDIFSITGWTRRRRLRRRWEHSIRQLRAESSLCRTFQLQWTKMQEAAAILRDLKCPFVINQNRYSIF